MRLNLTALVVAICCLSGFATAQPLQSREVPLIEVTGSSEMEVEPDQVFIHLTLQERADGREKLSITKQEESLRKELQSAGIDLAGLTLLNAMADYQRYRMLKKDVIITKDYLLKVPGAEQLTKAYAVFDRLNIQDAYVQRTDHSKMEELLKSNRIKAIKAAKDKVDYLLGAVGKSAGNPLYIGEAGNNIENSRPALFANYRAKMAEDVMESPGPSFQKIRITTSIMVRYEIK